MKKTLITAFFFTTIISIGQINHYQPIDPLPIEIINLDSYIEITNKTILEKFPDETTKFVMKELTESNDNEFKSSFKINKKDQNITIIFDWIKHNSSLSLIIDENNVPKLLNNSNSVSKTNSSNNNDANLEDFSSNVENANIVKLITGVGIRIKLNIFSQKKNIRISDLIGLSISAENKDIYGSIEIQSMGITGNSMTPLFLLPLELNKSSIQILLTYIASIKQKLYTLEFNQSDRFLEVQITPRIIGYENLSDQDYSPKQIQSFIYQAKPYLSLNN